MLMLMLMLVFAVTENLDEMLQQFRGREETLVTTLRTMQRYKDDAASVYDDSTVNTDGE